MKHSSLPLLEQNLRATGNNGEYQLQPIKVAVPNEQLFLKGVFCKPKNRSGYFYETQHTKERIVLHFTAGQLRSDLETLSINNRHVSTPFVIARDGTIYQLFSSKLWSGHLGKGIGNTNTGNAEDKKTIGIEISNYGFLKSVNGNLETIYSRLPDARTGKPGPADVYCSLDQKEAYTKLETPFRGQAYYPSYTPQQYNSLVILLRYLTAAYNIPRNFLPIETRFKPTESVVSFKGIVSHVNYRKDGKWDIGPAFDWDNVIKNVQSPVYNPIAERAAELLTIEGEVLDSEDKIVAAQPTGASHEDEEYDELSIEEKSAYNSASISKRKLYALIVGVSDYEEDIALTQDGVIFPRLSGCKADALKMKNYLEEESSFDVELVLLTDAEATKSAISTNFTQHLGQAQQDDVALFYFSGHGTQEYIDNELFTSETDGKSESIVCYYDTDSASEALLSDKELRWLISNLKVSDAHVVTIFDCCHSAGVSRASLAKNSFSAVVEKRIYFTFPKRNWNEYLFSQHLSQDEFVELGEHTALIEGKHIELSACESFEPALEVSGEGVFTKTLLKVLRINNGNITYSSLISQIRQYLRGVYEQKPRITVTGTDDTLINTQFLNKDYQPGAEVLAEVVFNEEHGWLLNRGIINGIRGDASKIQLYHADNELEVFDAQIKKVEIDHAQLSVQGLDQDKVYLTNVADLMVVKLNLYIAKNVADLNDQKKILDDILEKLSNKIILQNNENDADYVLRYLNGTYYITLPNDVYRPLTEQVEATGESVLVNLVKQLEHIAGWEYIKQLKNAAQLSAAKANSIKIEYSIANSPYQEYLDEELVVNFIQEGGKLQNSLKIKLTNVSNQMLYCSAILLASDFASFTGFLNPSVYSLGASQSVELNLNGNPNITLVMEEKFKWYNWESFTESIKLLVSTELFSADALLMNSLPLPATPQKEKSFRGAIQYAPIATVENEGWYTRDVNLHFINPMFNKITQDELDQMLKDEATADFALGLYFDAVEVTPMEFEYKLKPEIILLTDNTEHRGVIINLANMWARSRRNKKYRNDIARFPNRLRIVSEGDSWFQHPLVYDVIDHVSRTYPTYCVAAAGDTLRNIMSGDKPRGEYFLDAIREQKPNVFLLSGGGNDILGSQFRTYLSDNPEVSKPEGEAPERFLKDSLLKEVKSLMEIYSAIFSQIQVEFPNLKIIVHGYDYPVKLNEAKKGWLGRYMIEKGINRPGDRKAIIRYIMNNFNAMLKTVVNQSDNKNVTYLDLRDIVRYDTVTNIDQWYDEIHPNDDGFQAVSMRYIQKINQLIQSTPASKAAKTLEYD